MTIIAETKRIFLREFTLSDSENIFQLNADPEVLKYTGDMPFTSVSQVQKFLKNYSDYQNNGYGRWDVISKDGNRFLGWCGLKLN